MAWARHLDALVDTGARKYMRRTVYLLMGGILQIAIRIWRATAFDAPRGGGLIERIRRRSMGWR